MLDRRDLLLLKLDLQRHDHRSSGFGLIAGEQLALRHDQMDPGAFDLAQGADGTAKLAFERT